MKKSPPDFLKEKWWLALTILGVGMATALLWSFWTGVVNNEGYPESYILGPPAIRFNDLTDETLVSGLPNPYADPTSFYPPSTYVFLRALPWSDSADVIVICFLSLLALALLLDQVLRPVIPGAWARVSLSFLFLAISYPIVFCVDRGNIEIILVPLIGWAVYLWSRNRYLEGTLCLFPAICLKLYPVLFLVLLVRRKKIGMAVLCGAAAVGVTAASCFCFPEPAGVIWNSYRENLKFYHDYTLLGNSTIEGSASLWNTYKLVLVALQKWEIISIVNFGFDGHLIQTSYLIYSALFGLFAVVCLLYAWFVEEELARCITVLLLLVSIAAPSGADYRFMYASLSIIFLVSIPDRRRGDKLALVLVALAVIPKKEFLLSFVGGTETGYMDVSIQTVVNPILILAAMGVLLYQAHRACNWSQVTKRALDWFPLGKPAPR